MSRDPRLTIARRELRSLSAEKTIVLALAIQLFVAGFSSFLVVGLVSLYDPGSIEGQGLAVGVTGEVQPDLAAEIDRVEGMAVVEFDSTVEANRAFQERRVDAVLVPTQLDDGDDDRILVRATAPDENIVTTVTVVELREALVEYEATVREDRSDRLEYSPLPVPDDAGGSPYVGFTYTVLLPLLLFLPAFISGSIAVDSVSEELERGTLDLLRVAPVSLVGILDGKLLSATVLTPAQVVCWLALLAINDVSLANAWALVALSTGLAAAIVAVGVGIALVAPDRQQAQLVFSTGVLGAFLLAVVLPEHPANTAAKLAIGSATTVTWLSLAAILALGSLTLAGIRVAVGRLEPDDLGGR